MLNLINKYILLINVCLVFVYFLYFFKDYWFKCEYCNIIYIIRCDIYLYLCVY